MKKMKRFLALLLASVMVVGSISMTAFAEVSQKPVDGQTEGQPFASGTGGSTNFRIPCLVALDDGSIVGACDARWNHSSDACGLDTIVSRSADGGKTWNYTFANYLGDNGNKFDYNSTAFIDPALATDGETIWLVADLYPAGVAINTVPGNKQARPGHTGYTADGKLALAKATADLNGSSTSDARVAASYSYYLEKVENAADDAASYYVIKNADGTVDTNYTVDAFFNVKGNGVDTNLFFMDSPYFPFPTDFLYMTKSTDGGKTWSVPSFIDVKLADEQTLLVGPGRGIVTSTGRLIFTCYDFTYGDKFSACIYSDDQGKTWKRGQDVPSQSSEATITEADGRLYMFTRHGGYYISEDWGESWSQRINPSITYNQSCQLNVITYSEKIDGKTAIILSAPSSTSGRAAGKLFVGLVQEDKSIDWAYEYSVNGSASYAYSSLDEMSDGSIALLYETNGAQIVFTKISKRQLLGLEKNLELSYGDVYTETKSATEALEITQEPDSNVVTITSELVVEDETIVLHDHAANVNSSISGSFSATSNSTLGLNDCEFTFKAVGDYWNIYHDSKYMQIASASDYFGNATNMAVENKGNGVFRIKNASSDRYSVFYTTNMVFDAWGTPNPDSVTNAAVKFDLTLLEKQDKVSSTDIIPGYAKATEVKDGGVYLIAYLWDNDNVIVLYPEDGQSAQTKLVGDVKTVSNNVITITAVGAGSTTAVIGGVTYNITVPDPRKDASYSGFDVALEGYTYTTGSAQSQSGNEGPIAFAFDRNEDTFWHSEWKPSWSKEQMEDYLWVQFDLTEATIVDAVRYLARGGNGDISAYRVEGKLTADGEWTTLAEGTWGQNVQRWYLAEFPAVEVVAIRLVATDTYADSDTYKFASARELALREADAVAIVDKAALAEAIAAAEELAEDVYTAETWAVFAEALEAAKAVNEDAAATQDAVDKALADLAAAKTALEEKPAPVVNPFEDVADADYYHAPVLWAVENGITTGTSATTFSPEDTCTRGAVVTFLWRAAGCPEPEAKETAFVDVAEADYYYKAVLWAVENGITTGTSEVTFAPNDGCTRGQVVTFLFRAADEEVPADAENAFTDVEAGAYYADAVLWAVANGITTGTSETTFEPDANCTRGQIVTFIYRSEK